MRVSKLISTCAAAAVGTLFCSAAGPEAKAEPQLRPPPAPTQIYDPRPGPFIIRLDESGRVAEDQHDVIANAVANWSGETLQAFVICLRFQAEFDWDALTTVARALKEHGAQTVVTPSGGQCSMASPGSTVREPHVEIMGVVRL